MTTPRLPAVVLWVSGAVVVAAVVMGVVGALRSGISWDEPYHVMRLRNYVDVGWFALDWSNETGGTSQSDSNTLVYGPVTMLLLHGLAVLVGVEEWGSVATTPAAYDVRHLGVLLIGLVGTAAAAGTTRILLGSWRWALFTAAALLALPMWTGHLMFNIKDVPVATGYTVMTLALVSMVSPAQTHRVLRIGGLAAGITLMVGTRPAMASGVLAALVVLAAGVVVARPASSWRATAAEAAAGVAAAAALLLAVYPNMFTRPALLLQSTEQSASFRDGRDADYLYVPFQYLAQVPLLLQALFAIGLVSALAFAVRRWRDDPSHATRLALVGVQVLAVPLVGIARNSDLYNGLRQLLFASPMWAVLVTLGLAKALAWAHGHGRTRRGHALVSGLAVVALVAPMADQARLFPYQYTYYNVALDATQRHVESDYWRTSVPELLPDIPTDGPIVCGPIRSTPLGAAAGSAEASGVEVGSLAAGRHTADSSVDCRTDPLGPLSSAWTAQGLPVDDVLADDEFYAVIDRDHPLPRNCDDLAAVTRERHGREIAMTYVAQCRQEPSPLSGTVAFTRPDGEFMAPPLWSFAPLGWESRASTTAIDAEGESASLTFVTPPECARAACSLLLDADAPADLTATVDDGPAEVVVSSGSVSVSLAPTDSEPWVTFERASGDPLGLRVRTIRVVPSGASN